jgi:Family of unknown function (DUF5686)/CarboxypepD_reg-like domain
MKLLLLFILFPICLTAQSLQGRVMDAKGEALAFTSIWVENTNQGTLANEDGRFELRLKQGKNRLVFRHLGFAPKPVEIELANQESKEDVVVIMQEQAVALDEINVRALKEDPAIGIMRRMIAMAPFHLKELNFYQAKAYVKGGGKITSISKLADLAIGKQLEKDAGIKVGRTYVLEGINQVTYKRPNQVQERVISNRSNLPLALKGADAPNLRATQTNFYQQKVWGSLISPLAPQAFQFYNFSFLGSFTQGGKTISKIQVRPKAYAIDLFDGELLVVEDTWSIYSLRLNFKNSSGSFTLSQQNAEFQGVWMPINYEMRATMQVLGFGFAVNYVTQIKSYQIQVNPGFVVKPQIIEERLDKALAKEIDRSKVTRNPQSAFNGEITRKKLKKVLKQVAKEEVKEDSLAKEGISGIYEMTVDSLAPTHSEAFWNEEREVPLTEAEIKGFKEADSLYVFERAKMSKDSLNALPKFKLSHLFFAKRYTYEKNGLGNSFSIGLFGFGFTPVDGFYLNRDLVFNHQRKKTDYFKTGAYLRYAFARQGFNGDFFVENKSDEGRNLLNMTAGSQVANFSSAKTLPLTLNSSAALFDSRSYLYWYQKDFAQISFRRQVRASFQWRAELEYRNRSPLTNVVSNGWFQRQNSFRENYPLANEIADTRFETHNQWSIGASITWKPGSTWRLINQVRRVARSESNLTMKLETQAVLGDFGFSRIGIQVDQTVNLNRLGQLAYQVRYDDFFRKPRIFMDFTHFNANELNVVSSLPFGFSTLPMYQFSTAGRSLVFHAKWSPRKLLYTQSQWFYMYGLREHIRFSSLQTVSKNGKDGFYEVAYSLQGIFRTFGLEVAKPIGNWVPSEWKLSITAPF